MSERITFLGDCPYLSTVLSEDGPTIFEVEDRFYRKASHIMKYVNSEISEIRDVSEYIGFLDGGYKKKKGLPLFYNICINNTILIKSSECLIARGFTRECGATFRPLMENSNLLMLYAFDHERLSDENTKINQDIKHSKKNAKEYMDSLLGKPLERLHTFVHASSYVESPEFETFVNEENAEHYAKQLLAASYITNFFAEIFVAFLRHSQGYKFEGRNVHTDMDQPNNYIGVKPKTTLNILNEAHKSRE